jgi:hypothetical protein
LSNRPPPPKEVSTTCLKLIVNLDDGTKILFFFVILISNLAFLIYWALMMYQEVKSMIIKKLGKIYVLLCLCGDTEKLKRLEAKIKIREDNETLREKYMVILDDLSNLHSEGTLLLNERNIEKVHLYLQKHKVLKAAGIDPNHISDKEREKLSKRNKRKYINLNPNKQVLYRELEAAALETAADDIINTGFRKIHAEPF